MTAREEELKKLAEDLIAIRKMAKQRSNVRLRSDYAAMCSARADALARALLVEMEKGICRRVRIGLGAVAPKPRRAYETEKILTGKRMSTEVIATCLAQIPMETNPVTDIRATAEYRRSMTSVLLKRLIQQTLGVESQ